MEGQVVTRTPPASPDGPALAQRRGHSWREWVRSPFVVACVACAVLAAVSAAVLPTVPSYDPWAWISWGREVFDPHLSFATGGGPSWKPFPVLFTAVYGLFGGAAPTLWVITARAGGLLGLVAAYRLAVRLVRSAGSDSAPQWTAPAAGVIAGVGVVLTQQWAYYMFRGTSEPMLVGASLWAVDRHLDGRRGSAFLLGVVAALIRPEAWPFILLYAVWLWRGEPRLRLLVVLGLASIPFLWFVPPWIGSGQPFLAASHAKDYNGHLGAHPFLEVLRRGTDLQIIPALVLGAIGVAVAWWRSRNRLVLGLAVAVAAWWVLVIAMTLDGYPGLERFYLPAAGLTCVLAGFAIVQLADLGGRLLPARAGAVAVVLVAALVGVCVPFATSRISEARAQKPTADRAVTRLDQLSAAVAAVGGHGAVFPCHTSFAAVNHGVQTALAWKLHVTLDRVGTAMRHQGVWFVGPHDSIDGGPAALSHALNRIQLLARVGAWRVYRVWRQGHLSGCVGR